MPRPSNQVILSEPIPVAVSRLKVTKRNLSRVQEKHLLTNIEPMLHEAFQALRDGVRARNPKFIELAFQVAGLVNPNKGPSIITKVVNNNSASATSVQSETKGKISFESLIRKLDARDAQTVPVIDITLDDEE